MWRKERKRNSVQPVVPRHMFTTSGKNNTPNDAVTEQEGQTGVSYVERYGDS